MKTLFTKPIIIQLQPSLLLLGLLLAVAIISSLILLVLPIILAGKLFILGLIVLSSAYYIARDALLILPWSWRIVEVNGKGVLTLINKRQQLFKPELAASSFVHAYCVILNLKNQGMYGIFSPVLLFNNTDNTDALRRLRVWLRLYKNKRAKQTYAQRNQSTSTELTITQYGS